MNYNQFFKQELDKLKDEGNYRVFADLEKIAGNFPQALNYKENNVSEDDLFLPFHVLNIMCTLESYDLDGNWAKIPEQF